MSNKKTFQIIIIIMSILLLVMGVNRHIFSINDWIIRGVGLSMMICTVLLVFNMVMSHKQKQQF